MLELPSPLNPRNLQQSDPLVQAPEKNLRISWLERSQLTVFGVRWDSVPWTNFGWIFFNDALEEISSLSSFILGTSFVEKGAVSESSATISYPHLPKFFFFRNKQIAHLEGTEHPSILASVCWRILFWNLDSPNNQGGTVPFFDSFSAKLTESTRPSILPTQKNYKKPEVLVEPKKTWSFYIPSLSLSLKSSTPLQVGQKTIAQEEGQEDRIQTIPFVRGENVSFREG